MCVEAPAVLSRHARFLLRARSSSMSRRLLALALGVSVAVAPAGAAAMPDSGTAAPPSLRQLAKGLVAAGAPGAVVYVRDARGSRAGTAGYANLRTKERLGTTHVFRVGSITKTFVATVVLQLEAEGVLGLDDSLERWLPGLVPNGGAITLRQLLNHTSGIYNYTEDPAFSRSMARNPRASWTPEALVNVATAHRPLFAPGTDWSYSNTGYILLGLVIEKATRRSLGTELGLRIFHPLALSRTSLPGGSALAPPFAHGYLPPGGLIATSGGRPADITAWNPSSAWAAGAIASTAPDLARFYAALLGGKLLAPAQLRKLKTTVPGSEQYGLGINRAALACADPWGHGGSVPGYRTLAYNSEDGTLQAIVMVNGTSNRGYVLGSRFGDALESAFCR
jgi:D-alanyl-D-alanine carboxypeptidase